MVFYRKRSAFLVMLLLCICHTTYAVAVEDEDPMDYEEKPPVKVGDCRPNSPTYSVGDYFIDKRSDFFAFKEKNPIFILGLTDSQCKKCCYGEVLLEDIIYAFRNGKVKYKHDKIPVVRADLLRDKKILEEENVRYEKIPKTYIHFNGAYIMYDGVQELGFFLHTLNRLLYPVVLLRSESGVNRFLQLDQEWQEDTPFYRKGYMPMGDYYGSMKKKTRVIALVSDKKEFRDELKQFEEAAGFLAMRDDLRIAKLIKADKVMKLKKKYGNRWFGQHSSNSILLVQEDGTE